VSYTHEQQKISDDTKWHSVHQLGATLSMFLLHRAFKLHVLPPETLSIGLDQVGGVFTPASSLLIP
jgi:hypothetical protein